MSRIYIAPSVLAADFSCLASQIEAVEQAGADNIHLDIMDGHFVPNITFGPFIVKGIRKTTSLDFWVHLMITDPREYIPRFSQAGANGLYVHPEGDHDLVALASQIRSHNVHAGAVLNPETPLDAIADHIHLFDRILIMTVHPGFGGQTFIHDMLKKIKALSQLIEKSDQKPLIEVDGGIDVETAPLVVEAGARVLVAGSAIFGHDDPGSALKEIRQAAEAVLSR